MRLRRRTGRFAGVVTVYFDAYKDLDPRPRAVVVALEHAAPKTTIRRGGLMTDHLQEWLDDLRDPANQTKQGIGRLQSGADKFCCLGRLCLVAERHGVAVKRTPTGRIRGMLLTDQSAVLRWAGSFVTVDEGCIVRGRNVTFDNDSTCLTFAQIADKLDPQ